MRLSARVRTAVAVVSVVALALLLLPWASGSVAQQQQQPAQPTKAPNWLNPGPASPNALGPAIPLEIAQHPNDWPAPQGNLAGTRAAANSPINSTNVDQLKVAWSFPIKAISGFGGMSSAPLVVGDTIYLQDMNSNVFALDRATGHLKWEHDYNHPTEGPNGIAIGYGLIFGGTGDRSEAFALDAATGKEVWRVQLSANPGEGIDMAPTVYDNTVFISTVPGKSNQFYQGGQRGILYALDAKSGGVLWTFDTTTDNLWGNPRVNSGGGLWYPPAVDDRGNLYFGTGNPAPWPGVVANGTPYPNGSSRPGPNDYSSSMVSLDQNGSIRWHVNAKPHDLFDLDFQLTPILATVTINGTPTHVAIGSGKAGKVIAANADTGKVLWTTAVGKHQNDELQTLPGATPVLVYPGGLGAVESPMAFADGTVFVPVFDDGEYYTALTQGQSTPAINDAPGYLVAINAADGTVKWTVNLPKMNVCGVAVANDVVFTQALDGVLRALDTGTGKELWTYQAASGCNGALAIAGNMLLLPATAPNFAGGTNAPASTKSALVAFTLGPAGTGTPTAGTPAPMGSPSADKSRLDERQL